MANAEINITALNAQTLSQELTLIVERMNVLEARHAFQDDVIDQLNHEITIHQSELTELKQQLKLMANRLKEGEPSQILPIEDEPPPPHY